MQWRNRRPSEFGRVMEWNAAKESSTVMWSGGESWNKHLGQGLLNRMRRPSCLDGVTIFEAITNSSW